jgi:hypothetical protein
MRFTPREGTTDLQGTVNCGRTIVNLSDKPYETIVPMEQQILSSLRTINGRVFDAVVVKSDGSEESVQVDPDPEQVATVTPAEAIAQREQEQAKNSTPSPNAQGYDGLPDEELKTLIKQAGKPVPTNAQRNELVQILNEIGE